MNMGRFSATDNCTRRSQNVYGGIEWKTTTWHVSQAWTLLTVLPNTFTAIKQEKCHTRTGWRLIWLFHWPVGIHGEGQGIWQGLSDKWQWPPVTMSYLNEGWSLKEGRNGQESLQQREREREWRKGRRASAVLCEVKQQEPGHYRDYSEFLLVRIPITLTVDIRLHLGRVLQ